MILVIKCLDERSPEVEKAMVDKLAKETGCKVVVLPCDVDLTLVIEDEPKEQNG